MNTYVKSEQLGTSETVSIKPIIEIQIINIHDSIQQLIDILSETEKDIEETQYQEAQLSINLNESNKIKHCIRSSLGNLNNSISNNNNNDNNNNDINEQIDQSIEILKHYYQYKNTNFSYIFNI